MSFFNILYTLLIGPLQLVFELIYAKAYEFIGHPGLAIIVLSLMMNILVLPLYKRADAMQEEARDIDLKLKKGVNHIKKTFSGDEKMMILQTYYRQNNYKPTDAVKGSISLLLEIPFFIAAYQFLSHLYMIKGVSLGPIADLGAQDGLIHIGGLNINLLPILMTSINVISSAIYLKGFPLKTKIQLYGMAGFFLVFLYTSPAGLVFYWTLNNLFSLVKTIFYKLKDPRKVLRVSGLVLGIVVLIYGIFVYENPSIRRKLFIVAIGLVLLAPFVITQISKHINVKKKDKEIVSDKGFFLVCTLLLTVLVGVLIPSAVIQASPQEFINVTHFYNPLWYVASTLCMAAGLFLVWIRVFYWLAGPGAKVIFERIIVALVGIMMVDYMFFGTKLGILASDLRYESGMAFDKKEVLINIAVVLVVAIIMWLVTSLKRQGVKVVALVVFMAIAGMSLINVVKIHKSIPLAKKQAEEMKEKIPQFTLSQNGQNVVVIMMDRAMGQYVPYIFNEKPELAEKFDGFTYYSNVISYGGSTNFASPALFGGYEYTPVELNKRATEPLVSKQNEALKVMPVMFDEQGYEVTVCDPTYANYQWIPDLSIYDEYPDIETYITKGRFSDKTNKDYEIKALQRSFFCFSIMKTMPLCTQDMIYSYGTYNRLETTAEMADFFQVIYGNAKSEGMTSNFLDPYGALINMSNMTEISQGSENTFLMFTNDTTHEPMMLQLPNYEPAESVDNTAYMEANKDKYVLDGKTLKMNESVHVVHYQANMATMLRLADWFDYLRANDVYDNTRIIIVSDHGRALEQMDDLVLIPGEQIHDANYYFPLLMVKDFNSEGFVTDEQFMTNADVPTMAVEGLIEDAKNPFTGNEITDQAKYVGEQYIIASTEYDVNINNGNTFIPAPWYSVKDNIWDKNNWTFYEQVGTFPPGVE